MRRVLLTGFEPFPRVPYNPTGPLVRIAPSWVSALRIVPAALRIVPAILPVRTRALAAALAALEPENFDAVVHLGVATGRSRVSLERRAVNCLDFDVEDNDGEKPTGRPIDGSGPPHRLTRLPLEPMAAAFSAEGVPVEVSHSAGTYLCNQLMYLSLGMTSAPCGFIHIPPDETLAGHLGPGTAYLPLEAVARGLGRALEAMMVSLTPAPGAG